MTTPQPRMTVPLEDVEVLEQRRDEALTEYKQTYAKMVRELVEDANYKNQLFSGSTQKEQITFEVQVDLSSDGQ